MHQAMDGRPIQKIPEYTAMKNMLWTVLAKLLCLPFVTRYLVLRAKLTPYRHLSGYMLRWWLIREREGSSFAVRIHHILREDNDRHLHDHPWEFRSIILQGWYIEEYLGKDCRLHERTVRAGDTYCAPKGYYHRIKQVSPGGVRTLFITFRRVESWGFLVDGQHIPSDIYLQDKKPAVERPRLVYGNAHSRPYKGSEQESVA